MGTRLSSSESLEDFHSFANVSEYLSVAPSVNLPPSFEQTRIKQLLDNLHRGQRRQSFTTLGDVTFILYVMIQI